MKQLFLFVSLAVICLGLYLKFLYDVPDAQEVIYRFVRGFFLIIGISSLLINLFWKSADNKGPKE
jgi:hypothetical protein